MHIKEWLTIKNVLQLSRNFLHVYHGQKSLTKVVNSLEAKMSFITVSDTCKIKHYFCKTFNFT